MRRSMTRLIGGTAATARKTVSSMSPHRWPRLRDAWVDVALVVVRKRSANSVTAQSCVFLAPEWVHVQTWSPSEFNRNFLRPPEEGGNAAIASAPWQTPFFAPRPQHRHGQATYTLRDPQEAPKHLKTKRLYGFFGCRERLLPFNRYNIIDSGQYTPPWRCYRRKLW